MFYTLEIFCHLIIPQYCFSAHLIFITPHPDKICENFLIYGSELFTCSLSRCIICTILNYDIDAWPSFEYSYKTKSTTKHNQDACYGLCGQGKPWINFWLYPWHAWTINKPHLPNRPRSHPLHRMRFSQYHHAWKLLKPTLCNIYIVYCVSFHSMRLLSNFSHKHFV